MQGDIGVFSRLKSYKYLFLMLNYFSCLLRSPLLLFVKHGAAASAFMLKSAGVACIFGVQMCKMEHVSKSPD